MKENQHKSVGGGEREKKREMGKPLAKKREGGKGGELDTTAQERESEESCFVEQHEILTLTPWPTSSSML